MSRISQKIFVQMRKYPFLWDNSHPDHRNFRKREVTWEQIAKYVCGEQWDDLTLQEKSKKGNK